MKNTMDRDFMIKDVKFMRPLANRYFSAFVSFSMTM